jgi:hypothetical protein
MKMKSSFTLLAILAGLAICAPAFAQNKDAATSNATSGQSTSDADKQKTAGMGVGTSPDTYGSANKQ